MIVSGIMVICREEGKEAKLKAADSFLKLGEVSLETGETFFSNLH